MWVVLLQRAFASAVLLLAASLVAQAQETPNYNQISLQAQAQRDVVHDLMRVTLYTEAQGADAARLAEDITRSVNAATERARQTPGVRVQTGGRASNPVYDKNRQRIVAWRERADWHGESAECAALAALIADLPGGMKLAHRVFTISAASRKAAEDQLIEEAIAAFTARAQLAVRALGGKDYRLVGLNLDSGGFRPVVPMTARAMSVMGSAMAEDSGVAQEIAPGTSAVTVTAAGVVELQK